MPNMNKWANAIALRIADEWSGRYEFPEDSILLRRILTDMFVDNPDKYKQLIGTGIIEETYFELCD